MSSLNPTSFKIIGNIFNYESITRFANRSGYNIKADFYPGEFQAFSREVTQYALDRINQENPKLQENFSQEQKKAFSSEVSADIESRLRNICKCVPQSSSFPESGDCNIQ
jgi:hypothetical protein